MKVFILALYVGILAISLNSCERKQVTTAICFIDLSSRDIVTIQWYKETLKKHVLPNMPPNSRLVVLPIDYASQTGSKELFRVDFSKNTYGSEYAGLQAAEIEAQQHHDSVSAAIRQFDQLFDAEWYYRLRLPEGTDVFGALKQCSKYASPEQRTVVIMLSDMLQYTDKKNMNFETYLNTAEEVGHYLSVSQKVDLGGMEVVVLTGLHRTMKTEKYSVIKAFWEKYFTECNGELVSYSSGAVSQLETLLQTQE
jgi:hypothetical protein